MVFLNVRLVDQAGQPVIYAGIGPEIFAYRAEPATCAFFRSGKLAGSDQDNLVVGWGHTGKDGAVHLEVPANARYVILLGGPNGSWWKSSKSCDSADVLAVTTMDVSLDVPWTN